MLTGQIPQHFYVNLMNKLTSKEFSFALFVVGTFIHYVTYVYFSLTQFQSLLYMISIINAIVDIPRPTALIIKAKY